MPDCFKRREGLSPWPFSPSASLLLQCSRLSLVCIVLLLVESLILDARRAQASLVRLSAKWPLPLVRSCTDNA